MAFDDRVAPPIYVSAPQRQPSRFGLFTVANMVPVPEARFEAGIRWEPVTGAAASGVSGRCVPEGTVLLATEENVVSEDGIPFAVYGFYNCRAFSRSLDEAEAFARAHLANGEERAVERALAVGDLDNAPNFTDAVDVTPAGGATDPTSAVGLLEAALARDYGGQGVIHVPRQAGAHLSDRSVVSRVGQRLETMVGNFVAAEGGLDIAEDDGYGGPGDQLRFFATGIPSVRRSDVFITPDPEFRPNKSNDVIVVAQRVYLVSWDLVTFSVDVVLGGRS